MPRLRLALAALLLPMSIDAQSTPQPPAAPKRPHETPIHGITLHDDYFWLRGKSDPAVREYLEQENAYTAAIMKPTEGLQKQLYDEMLGRLKQTDENVPYREAGWLWYSRTIEGKQYAIYARKASASAPEAITLDVNAMAEGHTFYAIGHYQPSDDGNLLAYSVDTTGYRQYTLHVKDLRSGKTLGIAVPRVTSVEWARDGRTLLLVTEDEVTKRSDKVWRLALGDAAPTLVYDEKDELFDVGVSRSRDGAMLFITSTAKTSAEVRWLKADAPNATPTMLLPREPGHEYSADWDAGSLYLWTNKNAKNFRLVRAPLDAPDPSHWTDVVKHDPNVKLDGVDFFTHHFVLSERENGLSHLRVVDKATGASHRITTPEPVYTLALGNNPEYATDVVQFVYNSPVTPASTYAYDLTTQSRTLLKRTEVIGYDPSRYETTRVWATARDGTKVPVMLVYKKGVKMDGSAPCLLYGYGSYGVNIEPTFSSPRVSLLDRGMIYALASIRGGGELGETWREQGRMMQKMNTFTDFIDVAQYLIAQKYTSAQRLAIQGGSAGGLLMGAVANMRPDLFRAVVAQVPFVDVMNTMLDASLPLTTSEYIEWGNPNEKPAFDYMIQYSPYDNVKRQAYPAMLIEVSLNDSQVPYWEGAKFAAKLRATKTDSNVLLLKTNMGAGHGGSSGRYDRLKEVAFEYAFMLTQLGVNTTRM